MMISYGFRCGPALLAEKLETTLQEATSFISNFKIKYPGIARFLLATIEECRRVGYVETILGIITMSTIDISLCLCIYASIFHRSFSYFTSYV